MTASPAGIPTADQYDVLSLQEALERFPQFEFDTEDWDDDDLDSVEVVYLQGDYTLDGSWDEALDFSWWGRRFLLVEGNLRINKGSNFSPWVMGDIHADVLSMDGELQCMGTVHVKHYAYLYAEDHEVNRPGPSLTLNTPYLFSWFYSISDLTLSRDTLVFLLSDWDYSHDSDLPGTVIPWHEARFVLRDDLQYLVEETWHDSALWPLDRIREAMARGESILREGVTVAGIQTCKQAADAERMDDSRLAWLYYREAARLAPGYYPAVYNMGRRMEDVGADEQALPYLERAAALYPVVQSCLLNEAAFEAIITACWLGQVERAGDTLDLHIPHNQHYKMRRARAEVFLMTGYLEEARRDLEAVLQKEEDYGTALWLRGLVAWKLGKRDEALEWQQRAMARHDVYAASYETHQCAAFLRENKTTVDWESLVLDDVKPVQDEAWWLALLKGGRDEAFRVPEAMRTTAFLQALMEQQADDMAYLVSIFPAEAFTADLALQLVQQNGDCLKHIPPSLHSLALYQHARVHENSSFPLKSVPESLLSEAVCLLAVEHNATLEDVPEALRTETICRLAIERRGSWQIEHVPPALQTESMWVLAVAHSDTWRIENKIPSRYTTPAMLQAALKLNKGFLHGLPGNRFDAATYAVAESLYGQDADWADIVAQHRPEACMDDYDDFDEKCWLVFWDEASMLKKIRNGQGYRLSAYEIPESHFSEAIAEACFRAEPIHMGSIPAQFITEKMCQSFIGRYADELKDVPFAMRTVEICEVALRDEFEQLDLVPVPVFAEVMARLYKRVPRNVERDTVALQYGRGLLMAPADPKAAIKVLSDLCSGKWLKQPPLDPEQELDEDEAQAEALLSHACYLLGYAWHLRGDTAQAETLRQRSGLSGPYSSFDPRQGQAQGDFDKRAFDRCMHEYDQLAEHESQRPLAWQAILQARRLLEESGNPNPTLWAYVLDRQRWISYELEDWETNTAVCEEAVARLGAVSLWAYLPEHNVIRAALRAALHRLGSATLEDVEDPTEAQVIEAVERIWQALKLVGPTEDKADTYHFYDAQLWNLDWLAERDPKWQATLRQTMKRVAEFDWEDYLYTDEALAMMRAYTAAE